MEIVMEVIEELAEEYKKVVEDCMVRGGNKFLINNLFSMEAEAVIGMSWGETKG